MHSTPPNCSRVQRNLDIVRASHAFGRHHSCASKETRVRTHHVLDLREGDLQGDVQSAVRVSYRPQGAGIILHQIVEELLGVAALRRVNHWAERWQVPSEQHFSDDNAQTSPSGSSITKQITRSILSTRGQLLGDKC